MSRRITRWHFIEPEYCHKSTIDLLPAFVSTIHELVRAGIMFTRVIGAWPKIDAINDRSQTVRVCFLPFVSQTVAEKNYYYIYVTWVCRSTVVCATQIETANEMGRTSVCSTPRQYLPSMHHRSYCKCCSQRCGVCEIIILGPIAECCLPFGFSEYVVGIYVIWCLSVSLYLKTKGPYYTF